MLLDQELCYQHSNRVERICLDKNCQDRLMCLLCQHDHGQFKSICVRVSEDYRKFKNIINDAIDSFIIDRDNTQQYQVKKRQHQIIQQYYQSLLKQLNHFLNFVKQKSLKALEGSDQKIIQELQRVRIIGNHSLVRKQIFDIFLRMYEGEPLKQFFKSKNDNSAEQVEAAMFSLDKSLKALGQTHNFKFNLTPPQITVFLLPKVQKAQSYNYNMDQTPSSLTTRLKYTSNIQFDSVVSDCFALPNHVIASSYDKTLKIFDSQLNYLSNIQHQNIITKIQQIGDGIFAVGLSKILLIEKIGQQTGWGGKVLMKLKGHHQRINDISAFNSRIVGSSSEEGTKVWDLYKQKCQYTFRENASPSCFTFLKPIKQVAIGYNDHTVVSYSIQTLKSIRTWKLDGLPLCVTQQRLNENIFFVSGFPSNLTMIDTRLKKLYLNQNLKSEAITCVHESIFQQNTIMVGERGGIARIIDLKKYKTRHKWQAHSGKTTISKPNGIVKIFCQKQNQFMTVGCNDRKIKIWQVNQ